MLSLSFRKSFLFSILILSFALLWYPSRIAAAPILVDAFDQNPAQFLSVACCGGSDASAVDNPGALGGERDIETTMLTAIFGTQTVFAGPPLNSLYHAQQPLMTGWTRVSWDGDDDDPLTLNPTGLGGVEFTDGGSNSGLLVHINSANGSADLVFTAYTDGANISDVTLSLSGSTTNQSFFIPFADFAPLAGAGVDFTDVGAFELFIDGSSSPGFQIFLDVLTLSSYDFGDLPTAYNLTTLADDGARHIIGDLYLGTAVDGEADGQESANADGDDTNGLDDEDGVLPVGTWVVGVNGGTVDVVASGAGCLSGWIDWANNNNFSNAGDDVIVMAEVTAGTNTISFDIPPGTVLTDTFFSRFRLVPDTGAAGDCSDDTPVGLAGEVSNGEVEDYLLSPASSLSINNVTVDEGAGSAIFTVSLSSAIPEEVSVNFTTDDGTAVAPDDYTATNGTITIPANTLSTTLSVTIIDDQLAEATETFTVNLSNPTNASIADGQGVGTILDNDNAPIANDDVYTTTEEITLNIVAPGVLTNDSDIDLDPLTAVLDTNPSNGNVTLNLDGSFIYTPTADFNGSDSFTYHASDGTNESNIATVTINVTPVNDSLTAVDDEAMTDEDLSINIDVLANDIDVDGDANVVTVTMPANGTTSINANNTIHYAPDAEFSGMDIFQYNISDGVFTDTATVTVTVNAVNDPPTAVDDADITDEDVSVATNVLLNDLDIDGNIDPTTLSVAVNPSNGSAIADPASGVVTYTPSLNFYGLDSYMYQICDDGTPLPPACSMATVEITVAAVNDPPIAVDDTTFTLPDTPVDVDVLANDIDVDFTDTFTVTAVTQPPNGITSINPDSTVTYTPTLGFMGMDVFDYTVSDGVYTDTAVVTITVTDMPIAVITVVTTPTLEGTPIQFNGAVNGSGTVLWDFGEGTTTTSTLTPTHTYPDNGTFTVTLTFTNTDGDSASDFVVLDIANVAPIVSAGPDQTVTLGTAVTFNGSFSDPGTLDTHFIQWDLGDGNSVFNTLTPNHTYTNTGTYTVTLTVMDNDNGSSTDQLIVNVVTTDTFANYLPIILNNTVSAPDLEIQMLAVTADNVTIVIENTGSQAVSEEFWVDLYINPDPVPTGVNQTWEQLSEEGVVWGITDVSSLVPGGILTIDLNHPSLDSELTDFSGTFINGMEIYVQVDSANTVRPSGGVLETHEILNGPYNNIAHVTVALNP